MKKVKIKILKENNNPSEKYQELVNANIKTILLSTVYKSSRALNKFYSEDIKELEGKLRASIVRMAANAKIMLDSDILNNAVSQAVKDAISGRYDSVKESLTVSDELKSKEKRIKDELKSVRKSKELEKIKKSQERIKKLSGIK